MKDSDSSMKDSDSSSLDSRRRALSSRLSSASSSGDSSDSSDSESSGSGGSMSLGFRLLSDFVVFVLVGVFLGYGIDILFGTLPFGLIFLSILGFIGAIRHILGVLESDSFKKRS